MQNQSIRQNGYTLLEVMIGMSILALAVGGASILSMTAAEVENRNRVVARGHSLVEAAHNLYQLGLAPTVALGLLPSDPNVVWSAPATSKIKATSLVVGSSDISDVEGVSLTATISDPPGDAGASRTVTVESLRERSWFR